MTEVGGRAADIVDIAFEVRHGRDGFGLFQHGFMAAGGDDASLQERDRTERARAKTTARLGDGELNLFYRRNAALRIVIRMPGSLEGERVYVIKLFTRERHVRHGLHNVSVAVFLADGMAAHGILLVVLNEECFAIFLFAGHAFLAGWDFDAAAHGRVGHVAYAAHLRAFPGGRAAAHPVRSHKNGALAHAEHQQIGRAVHQNAPAHAVVPVIVMRKLAQRRFDAADGDRNVAVSLTNQVAVNDHRAVGALGGLAAGGVYVGGTALFRCRVVIDHAVNHAGGHQKAVVRPAKTLEVRGASPVRLGEHGYAVAGGFQRARDHGGAEGWMVDIRVAVYVNKIRCIPAAGFHVLGGRRRKEKAICHNILLSC